MDEKAKPDKPPGKPDVPPGQNKPEPEAPLVETYFFITGQY